MKNLMIDLETMGMTPDGVIAQLGYALFDPTDGKIIVSSRINVDMESCVRAGLRYSEDVIRWWLGQDDAARKSLADPAPISLPSALGVLQMLYTAHSPSLIWSWGTDFDIAILRLAFRGVGWEEPWNRRMIRDARTLVSQVVTREEMDAEGKQHHAADLDCAKQIRWLLEAAKRLGITLK